MAEPKSPSSAPSKEPQKPARRRARLAAWGIFLGLVIVWVVSITAQLTQQALFPNVPSIQATSCSESLLTLQSTLDRGRASAEGHDDPDDALRRFRTAIEPEWDAVEAVRQLCSGKNERAALDALERLRYAEEHAVRREAASLAALRRQVASTLETLARPH